MISQKTKRLIMLNAPYVILGLLATKLGEVWRLAEVADFWKKMLHISEAFDAAFRSPLPSFRLPDILIGICFGAAVWVAVYVKGKNVKKYRRNTEYGSARWGTVEDIAPYIDPVFSNNVILTQTERLLWTAAPKIRKQPAIKMY